MSAVDIEGRYRAYAAAFEVAFETDDWSVLEPFFTDAAVYEGEPEGAGRAGVIAKMQASVNAFDRKMDARSIELGDVAVDGRELRVTWTVRYRKSGCPDLEIRGAETATFDGERIAVLRDDFEPESETALQTWLEAHGGAL